MKENLKSEICKKITLTKILFPSIIKMTIGIVMTIYIVINSTSFWGCTGFDRSVAVSYTHLDVYKRQA